MRRSANHRRRRLSTALRTAGVLLSLALLAISLTVLRPWLTSVSTYEKYIDALDAKKATVMDLAAASTAASAAITVIPDDIGTPIADKLADLSFYLMLILGTLYLEKYLLTVIGGAATCFLLPLAALMYAAYFGGLDRRWLPRMATRLLLFSLVFLLVIPVGLTVSDMIDETYRDSIQETIALASEVEPAASEAEQTQSFWEKITSAASRMVNGVSDTVDWAKHVLNGYMEAIAVLLVTNCVIPVLVLLFCIWLARQFLRVGFDREESGREAGGR